MIPTEDIISSIEDAIMKSMQLFIDNNIRVANYSKPKEEWEWKIPREEVLDILDYVCGNSVFTLKQFTVKRLSTSHRITEETRREIVHRGDKYEHRDIEVFMELRESANKYKKIAIDRVFDKIKCSPEIENEIRHKYGV